MLYTIKNKLALTALILVIGFSMFGFLTIKMGNDAHMAAYRLMTIGQTSASINASMMELRGFQLLGDMQMFDRYNQTFETVNKNLDALLPILLSPSNQERIKRLKKDFNAWHDSNAERLKIIQKYGKSVNSELFEKEHKAEYTLLNTQTQKSASIYLEIIKQINELNENVKKNNFERLETNEMLSESVLGVISLFVLVFFFFISNSIKGSVFKAKEACEYIRQTKDLHTRINLSTKDEIYEIMQIINTLLQDIEDAIMQAKSSSHENASVAEELSKTSLQIGKRVEDESIIVQETTNLIGVVSKDVSVTSNQSVEVKNSITNAQSSLMRAQRLLQETLNNLETSAEAENQINDKLNHLANEAQQVRTVLDVIGDIADQTNLLALNAAIEAARAGEHGRGFAVVADEVRKLAERTQKSLVETNATVNVIVQSIGDISGEMNINVKRIHELSNFSHQVTLQTNEAVEMLDKSVFATQDVVKTSQDNSLKIQREVIPNIDSINSLSRSNTRSVEEIAAAAEHLARLAAALNNSLSQFKTS